MSNQPSQSGRALRKRTPVQYAENGPSKALARRSKVVSRSRKHQKHALESTLSDLMRMPVDIFFEIASRLHPLDILHVARTSTHLRSILLSRKSKTVWKASFGAIGNLPPCPEDMSEPAHAALLFDKICTLCSASPTVWVDYAIRLKLCKPCHSTHIKKGKDIVADAPPVSDTVARLCMSMIPCEIGKHNAVHLETPATHLPSRKYYAPQLRAALDTPIRPRRHDESLDSYVNDLAADSTRRHKHATALIQWEKDIILQRKKATEDLKGGRRAIVIGRLKQLGYTEADIPDTPAWSNLVDGTKELTERKWNSLRPKLEARLQEEKNRRIGEVFDQRVEHRLQQLSTYYAAWVEDIPEAQRALMPNAYDGGRLPCLEALAKQNDAQGEISLEDFRALVPQVREDAVQIYLPRAKDIAVTMLHDAIWKLPDHEVWHAELEGLSADAALSRHYALFECEERLFVCNTGILTFEGLHAHWRAAHPQTAWGTAGPPQLFRAPGSQAKLHTRIICRGSYQIGGDILDAVGLSRDTPRGVLDGLVRQGRLYCACGDPSMSSPDTLDWVCLYAHITYHRDTFEWRMSELPREPNPNVLLKSNHSLAGPDACVKLLPEGADTSPASTRVTVDGETRARIQARLAASPRPDAAALCRPCRTLTVRSRLKYGSTTSRLTLPGTPEGIVYHLRGWHGKEFEERDVVWIPSG